MKLKFVDIGEQVEKTKLFTPSNLKRKLPNNILNPLKLTDDYEVNSTLQVFPIKIEPNMAYESSFPEIPSKTSKEPIKRPEFTQTKSYLPDYIYDKVAIPNIVDKNLNIVGKNSNIVDKNFLETNYLRHVQGKMNCQNIVNPTFVQPKNTSLVPVSNLHQNSSLCKNQTGQKVANPLRNSWLVVKNPLIPTKSLWQHLNLNKKTASELRGSVHIDSDTLSEMYGVGGVIDFKCDFDRFFILLGF